ncbi:MAG: RNA methyltransferase [Lachnospiraceae bacterium]|nr:RNA methyltransferase [Lachnospiraceae bacterium]
MITSTSNQQIKNLSELLKKPKARKEQQVFVVEGKKMFDEVCARRGMLVKAYFSESYMEENFSGCEEPAFDFEVVSDSVFNSVAETVTPQGVLAIIRVQNYEISDIMKRGANILILEDIQDPGNLGTMFRTAEAAGMAGIIMSKNTVDIYNPKVIRSTMGAIFRLPFVYVTDLKESLTELKNDYNINLIATHLAAKCDYTQADYSKGVGILIGNEGNGLSDEISAMADERVIIPMCGEVESLNAAVAAALMMFECRRH